MTRFSRPLMPPPPVATPELDKRAQIVPYSQKCGEFLEWLQTEKGVQLVTEEETTHEERELFGEELFLNRSTKKVHSPFIFNMESLLAQFFDIDLVKVEEERRAILESLRKS